jgi:hypothetical protein
VVVVTHYTESLSTVAIVMVAANLAGLLLVAPVLLRVKDLHQESPEARPSEIQFLTSPAARVALTAAGPVVAGSPPPKRAWS